MRSSMVLLGVLRQLSRVCRDGIFWGGKAMGLSSGGSSGRPVVPTLGSPVPVEGQSKDIRQEHTYGRRRLLVTTSGNRVTVMGLGCRLRGLFI
jgi:hypothetical protein